MLSLGLAKYVWSSLKSNLTIGVRMTKLISHITITIELEHMGRES